MVNGEPSVHLEFRGCIHTNFDSPIIEGWSVGMEQPPNTLIQMRPCHGDSIKPPEDRQHKIHFL